MFAPSFSPPYIAGRILVQSNFVDDSFQLFIINKLQVGCSSATSIGGFFVVVVGFGFVVFSVHVFNNRCTNFH